MSYGDIVGISNKLLELKITQISIVICLLVEKKCAVRIIDKFCAAVILFLFSVSVFVLEL